MIKKEKYLISSIGGLIYGDSEGFEMEIEEENGGARITIFTLDRNGRRHNSSNSRATKVLWLNKKQLSDLKQSFSNLGL